MKKLYIRTVIAALLLILAPQALAADRALACKTPPVTEAFLREMDDYVRTIENEFVQMGVANCGKEGQMTLFGMSFYPDITDTASNQQEGDYFGDITSGISMAFSQVADVISLTTSPATSFKEFTSSFSSSSMSHALYMDVQEVNKRLRTMEALLARTRYSCAYYLEQEDPSASKTSRYQDVKAHYMAYRQLYYWLLSADQVQIADGERALPRGNSTGVEYDRALDILARSYITLVQVGAFFPENYMAQGLDLALTDGNAALTYAVNPFYVQEYVGGVFSECQATDIGAQRIDASVRSVENAMDAVVKTMEDTGNLLESTRQEYAQAFEEFVVNPPKALQNALHVRTDFRTNLKLIIQSNYSLYAGSNEAESGSRRITERVQEARGTNGPTLPPKTTEQIASEQGIGTTLSGLSTAASQENARVAAERQRNMRDYYMQLIDNNSGERINQLYLSTMQELNDQVLTPVTKELKTSADTLSYLCKTHLPQEGEDCGELAKP